MSQEDRIRQWMVTVMGRHHLTVAEWSRLSGVHKSTIHRALSPDSEFLISNRTLEKLADAVATKFEIELTEVSPGRQYTLPIERDVGPGLWVDDYEDQQVLSGGSLLIPAMGYRQSSQYLVRHRGDSMDLEYKDGDYIHIVTMDAAEYTPRPKDHVMVVRRREATGGTEFTIREVSNVSPDAVAVVFRSTNERWSAPLIIDRPSRERDGLVASISGLVLGSWRSRGVMFS